MVQSINDSLELFNLTLEQKKLPVELGGYYTHRFGKKKLVVNQALPYENKLSICLELIFKHCLESEDCRYIPCYVDEVQAHA